MSEEEVRRHVCNALHELLEKDQKLLEFDVNERSITHHLALYLEPWFKGWDVDCEYNRTGSDPKRLHAVETDLNCVKTDESLLRDTQGRTVFPDIIVHKRGTDCNLLAIELKKTTNRVPRDVDCAKLRGYRDDPDLRYQHACFILIGVKDQQGEYKVTFLGGQARICEESVTE